MKISEPTWIERAWFFLPKSDVHILQCLSGCPFEQIVDCRYYHNPFPVRGDRKAADFDAVSSADLFDGGNIADDLPLSGMLLSSKS